MALLSTMHTAALPGWNQSLVALPVWGASGRALPPMAMDRSLAPTALGGGYPVYQNPGNGPLLKLRRQP